MTPAIIADRNRAGYRTCFEILQFGGTTKNANHSLSSRLWRPVGNQRQILHRPKANHPRPSIIEMRTCHVQTFRGDSSAIAQDLRCRDLTFHAELHPCRELRDLAQSDDSADSAPLLLIQLGEDNGTNMGKNVEPIAFPFSRQDPEHMSVNGLGLSSGDVMRYGSICWKGTQWPTRVFRAPW